MERSRRDGKRERERESSGTRDITKLSLRPGIIARALAHQHGFLHNFIYYNHFLTESFTKSYYMLIPRSLNIFFVLNKILLSKREFVILFIWEVRTEITDHFAPFWCRIGMNIQFISLLSFNACPSWLVVIISLLYFLNMSEWLASSVQCIWR